jgi:hypothetical protein
MWIPLAEWDHGRQKIGITTWWRHPTPRAKNGEVTASRIWLPIAALGLVACKGPLKKEHESLARALAEPASILCQLDLKEGGGCHGDCLTRNAANNGFAFARASRLLKDLPRVQDPSTETDVTAVRDRAADVARGFGPACHKPTGAEGTLSLETQACAHVYEKTWHARGQLLDALGTLRDAAEQSSGVELPDHRKCAKE